MYLKFKINYKSSFAEPRWFALAIISLHESLIVGAILQWSIQLSILSQTEGKNLHPSQEYDDSITVSPSSPPCTEHKKRTHNKIHNNNFMIMSCLLFKKKIECMYDTTLVFTLPYTEDINISVLL